MCYVEPRQQILVGIESGTVRTSLLSAGRTASPCGLPTLCEGASFFAVIPISSGRRSSYAISSARNCAGAGAATTTFGGSGAANTANAASGGLAGSGTDAEYNIPRPRIAVDVQGIRNALAADSSATPKPNGD